MTLVMSAIFFVLSFLNGAWSTPSKKSVSLAERFVCSLCGLLSVVMGFFFVMVLLLWMSEGESIEVKGFISGSCVLIASFMPGVLGVMAARWAKAKTAQLEASQKNTPEQ